MQLLLSNRVLLSCSDRNTLSTFLQKDRLSRTNAFCVPFSNSVVLPYFRKAFTLIFFVTLKFFDDFCGNLFLLPPVSLLNVFRLSRLFLFISNFRNTLNISDNQSIIELRCGIVFLVSADRVFLVHLTKIMAVKDFELSRVVTCGILICSRTRFTLLAQADRSSQEP